LELQDKRPNNPEAKVISTQTVKTEYGQHEVILQSDGTWAYEDTSLNHLIKVDYPCKILIPRGYVGWISIHYGVKDAPPLTIEGDHILYRVPPNGELKTSSLRSYSVTDLTDRNEVYEYSGRNLTLLIPSTPPKKRSWRDSPSPPAIPEEMRTIRPSDDFRPDESEGSFPKTHQFFVGTAQQLREHQEDKIAGPIVPLAPEVEDHWNDPAVDSSTIIYLTAENIQRAFTKSGRAVTLKTDANNYRTWAYDGARPVRPSDSVLNAELSEAIEEGIKLLEAHRYEAFWRRFWNPYLDSLGYERARSKIKPLDIVELLINLYGSRERFDETSRELGSKFLEMLYKTRGLHPVYDEIEYSENIRASFFEDGKKNPDLKGQLVCTPFIRASRTWYIDIR
jgi:hypothetical protein